MIYLESLIHRVYFSNGTHKKHSHYHDCYQIIFILKGNVEFCVNQAIYKAGAGNIAIFSRYEKHSLRAISNEYERYVLQINPGTTAIESRIYSLFINRPKGFCNIIDVNNDTDFYKRQFDLIINEQNSENKMRNEMLKLLVNVLLIRVYRNLNNTSVFESEDAKTVYEIQKKMETNYWKNYSLKDIAKDYNISVSKISHTFKEITGTSVMGHLLSCRMAAAKKYLAETNESISEIVEKCGFSDSSNFSRTFKELNGISPSRFRKKYRKTLEI